ncbi:putative porin precursor [Prochlorococcus marinus str. MIT 9302]|uniref:Putative porin n=2 Tax=Prochlorococcus marinus TaxID=1219 RepID=A0A0A2A7M1_PROMR|nr:putative porin precursor [Prochlorococcus marinus str. MIT 9302]
MLVAGASVSLLAPIAAQASDVVNLEEMNSYSRSTKKKSSRLDSNTFINKVSEDVANLDGLEARQNEFEAGTFSSTTSMDGKAIFWVGGIDGISAIDDDEDNSLADEGSDSFQTGYTYTMNLNTSFTGDDNLYVRLKAGETGEAWKSKPAGYHIDTKDTNDQFRVDKIWYSWPIGDNITAFVGGRIENYYMYVTPSIYKPGALKAFKLGGNSNFGASTDVGAGLKYEADNGFAVATNVVDKNSDANGIFQADGVSKWDTQIAYTQDRYHLSLTYSNAQNWTSQSYNATALGENTATDSNGYAARAYWMPADSGTAVPEITIGYDVKHFEDAANGAVDEAESWMVGFTWKDIAQADDRIGIALTQPLKATSLAGGNVPNEVDDPLLWEVYYSWKVNDSMSVTPAIFGGRDSVQEGEDTTGAVVTTAFKF